MRGRKQVVRNFSARHNGTFDVGQLHLIRSSVRNGSAGRPAALHKFGCAVWSHAKRTVAGLAISAAETSTVSPAIFASAGTNFPSAPAIANHVSGWPSFLIDRKSTRL